VEVKAAVVPGSNANLTWGGPGSGNRTGESAKAVVARKSVKTDGAKGRTGQERSDRVEDAGPVDASKARER
jgi:hypothetical protein